MAMGSIIIGLAVVTTAMTFYWISQRAAARGAGLLRLVILALLLVLGGQLTVLLVDHDSAAISPEKSRFVTTLAYALFVGLPVFGGALLGMFMASLRR